MNKCKYAKKSYTKEYVTCGRDGSRRKKPCYCSHFKLSWWRRLFKSKS